MALNQSVRIKFAEEVFGISEMDVVITEEGYKEGKTVYTVQPVQSYKKVEDSKQSLEFSRYKQDCRKRALDLAHQQVMAARPYLQEGLLRKNKKDEQPSVVPPPVLEDEMLMACADKYYNWLISIPETK